MRLDSRVAVITGASRGIGRAISLAYAREGASVVLAARSAAGLDEAAEEIRAPGARALPVPTDVTRIVFWEEARSVPLHDVLRPTPAAALLFGPEGGLTADEVTTAQDAGFVRAGLGPRILRAETAPIAALAILQYVGGDIR